MLCYSGSINQRNRIIEMNTQIKIAVVGFGLIGKRHVDIIVRTPGIKLCGVVEPSKENAADASRYGAPVFNTIEELFNKDVPDGIVLATPTPLHLEQGLLCIDKGCPLLVEKPITVTSLDASKLTAAAAEANVPLLVGHHRRHNGMVQAAKAALSDGLIGNIRAIQGTCWFYKPDDYFDKAPWRKKKGAGPISVNLVHDVDLLRHFCGDVSSVRATSVRSQRGFENEDLATAVLCFTNGAIATISVSDSIVGPWSWELTARENAAYPATSESCYLIGGSLGGMSLPDLRVWKHEKRPDWWTPITATNLKYKTEDPLHMQMLHFGNVILGEEEPLVSGLEGLKSLEVVEAVAASAESGKEIFLDNNDLENQRVKRFGL